MRIVLSILALSLLAAFVPSANALEGCENPAHSFGPYDYTRPSNASELAAVEWGHFTDEMYSAAILGTGMRNRVDQLGNAGLLAAHLDYTLQAFPNHHRALYATGIYQAQVKRSSPEDYAFMVSKYGSADCYYRAALDFAPQDAQVHGLYGLFLYQSGETRPGLERMKNALRLAPEDPELNYNAGLIYLRLGELEQARQHANRAYDRGYPLPYLRNELSRRGYDFEPESVNTAEETQN